MAHRLPPLTSLKSFAEAAKEGSFSRASEKLFVTQGAVSRQVKQLEQWLGKPLFYRTTQGIQLTDGGKMLAEVVEQSFGKIEEAVLHLQHTAQHPMLSINVPPTFATRWLAPRLSTFRKLYPRVDITIHTEDLRVPRDMKGLDCAVIFSQTPWTKYDLRRLRLEQHIMVASPALWVDELPPRLEHTTLLHVLDGEERLPVWETWCSRHNITHLDTKPGLSFSTLDQVINAAVSGAGAAIVDEPMVARELTNGTLRKLNRLQMEGTHGYWFASLASDQDRLACVQLFGEWLVDQVDGPASVEVPFD